MTEPVINIADIIFISEVNGPGRRSVIWLQGCGKTCVNCCNPSFRPSAGGRLYTPGELVRHIAGHTRQFADIEGITFSGGEPFDQAPALLNAAELFRRHGLTLMAYSGYTISELQINNPSSAALLGTLDILVDGEYVESLACSRLWRSSFNQTVHFLTPRYRHYADRTEQPVRECEMILDNDRLVVTGFPESSNGTSDLFHSNFSQR